MRTDRRIVIEGNRYLYTDMLVFSESYYGRGMCKRVWVYGIKIPRLPVCGVSPILPATQSSGGRPWLDPPCPALPCRRSPSPSR